LYNFPNKFMTEMRGTGTLWEDFAAKNLPSNPKKV
jgi:hypothetical protein